MSARTPGAYSSGARSSGRAPLGRRALGAAALLASAIACRGGAPSPGAPSPDALRDDHRAWPDYGGRPDQSRYVALGQITKENVARLRVAWTYRTGDSAQYQFNPVVVDTMMYVLARNGSLVALHAATGRELWVHANLRGVARRGVNYWESADRRDRRILLTVANTLQAIDATTGRSILGFGDSGVVDLREGFDRPASQIARVQSGTPGRVFGNLLLLGSSTGEDYFSTPGDVRAYDVVTGKLAWTFHTIPRPGEFGHDTWPEDAHRYAGGVNAWGEISLDARRGIAYVPLGSPTYDYYGADRVGANLFGSSLVALDARTGRRLWHFQFVHHDLWDYDPTAAPQLVTVRHGGRTIDAVAQATKQGFLFAFDRATGAPLWPIEERPVPPSDVPGERAWPTQPFPTRPAPFARQTMTSAELTPFFLSDAERARWTRRVDAARKGLFTPPSLTQEVLALPGAVGGANWGNSASDPARGLVYVLSQDFPSFYKLERPGARGAAAPDGPPSAYAEHCVACHGPAGEGGTAPAIRGVQARLSPGDFRFVVASGGAQMPAFPHIADPQIREIYQFLGGRPAPNALGPDAPVPNALGPDASAHDAPAPAGGPVVASGGAARRPAAAPPRPPATYPEGVDAPAERFTTDYGLGHPYIAAPPWSTLTAYDLNGGVIRWRVPVGQDRDAAREGGRGTGVPRGAQRNGMLVTETGLVFATAKDGHVYAFDAEDGRVLWAGALPAGTEGLPAMYEVGGRQHLVVNATTPLTWGRRSREGGIGADGPRGAGGYVVFALP